MWCTQDVYAKLDNKEFQERSSRITGFAEALLPSYVSVNQTSCTHGPCKPGNWKWGNYVIFLLLFKIDIFHC